MAHQRGAFQLGATNLTAAESIWIGRRERENSMLGCVVGNMRSEVELHLVQRLRFHRSQPT